VRVASVTCAGPREWGDDGLAATRLSAEFQVWIDPDVAWDDYDTWWTYRKNDLAVGLAGAAPTQVTARRDWKRVLQSAIPDAVASKCDHAVRAIPRLVGSSELGSDETEPGVVLG
jgi:hypothetical protein